MAKLGLNGNSSAKSDNGLSIDCGHFTREAGYFMAGEYYSFSIINNNSGNGWPVAKLEAILGATTRHPSHFMNTHASGFYQTETQY